MDYKVNRKISDILNSMKDNVYAVRGNCDTTSFEEMLDFELLDVDYLYINKRFVTITHGHLYTPYNLPPNCGSIFISGHTHVPLLIKQKDMIFANPGSITRPRGTDLRCYILIDDDKIILKEVKGNIVKSIDLE